MTQQTDHIGDSNKMVTAVEWLKKELEDYGDSSMLHIDWKTLDELCDQAKEMERKQRNKACSEAYEEGYEDGRR